MKRIVIWSAGILAILLIAGYFIAGAVIHKKLDVALAALPPSLQVRYTAFQADIFNGTIDLKGVSVKFTQGERVYKSNIEHLSLEGIRWFELARTQELRSRRVLAEGIELKEEKQGLVLRGRIELDSVYGSEKGERGFGDVHLWISQMKGRIPHADETIQLSNLELDSRKRLFRLDTLRVLPELDKMKMGKDRGHQVDVWETKSEGIEVEGLDFRELWEQRIVADRVSIRENHLYVFRDRRLPLEKGEKPMPAASLKALPVSLRIKIVRFGPTQFSYEEFPKEGEKMGMLKIYRMSGSLEPLINKPKKGDPGYLTLYTKGSLMNSGTVEATTKLPLHDGDPYRVEGAFHELDVTKLNDPAENLGHLHLESGMLNRLDFHFEMSGERATGAVTGRYHELVVDKLKNSGKKDKFKSFALKHFIIPRNKESAEGKVNYKRDPERYFSYYLLHSLLVGVKSSFSLGFLLPG
jgi:hypothetical protein